MKATFDTEQWGKIHTQKSQLTLKHLGRARFVNYPDLGEVKIDIDGRFQGPTGESFRVIWPRPAILDDNKALLVIIESRVVGESEVER